MLIGCILVLNNDVMYDCKRDPEAKVIAKITRTGLLIICCTRLAVLLYHAQY